MTDVQGRRPVPGARDGGSGTVLVLGLVAVVIGLIGALAGVGAAVLARHRAEAAADLAALAAAAAPGSPDCERARAVAGASKVRLTACRVLPDGTVAVEVVVAVRLGPGVGGPDDARAPIRARARARAGRPP